MTPLKRSRLAAYSCFVWQVGCLRWMTHAEWKQQMLLQVSRAQKMHRAQKMQETAGQKGARGLETNVQLRMRVKNIRSLP